MFPSAASRTSAVPALIAELIVNAPSALISTSPLFVETPVVVENVTSPMVCVATVPTIKSSVSWNVMVPVANAFEAASVFTSLASSSVMVPPAALC